MSLMVSFCAVLFPRGVLDEILNLIESVSEGFPSFSCFLSAAQDVMKEAIYLDNIVFETNLRLKIDLTYIILRKYTCKTYENRLYKKLDANLYRGAKTWC